MAVLVFMLGGAAMELVPVRCSLATVLQQPLLCPLCHEPAAVVDGRTLARSALQNAGLVVTRGARCQVGRWALLARLAAWRT
eukprot:11188717-Alexandrium_andersonii.AAC.1